MRLLAVDLDGTLLDAQGRPHERDARALRAALAAGVRVTVVTGRLYSGTRALVQALGLEGAVGCADGSHLVRARDHATLLHRGVAGAEAHRLRDAFARAGVATFVFARDAVGHDAGGAAYVDYVTTWSTNVKLAADVFAHELWEADDGVTAVVGVGTRETVTAVVQGLARALPDAVLTAAFPVRGRGPAMTTSRGRGPATQTQPWAVIARAAGGTKGTALRWIAEHEGVRLEETVAVGDWINDVPMFEVAGRSFAMGQAPPEVKAKATDVLTATAEEGGGVAQAVEAAFGIGL